MPERLSLRCYLGNSRRARRIVCDMVCWDDVNVAGPGQPLLRPLQQVDDAAFEMFRQKKTRPIGGLLRVSVA